MDVVELTHEYYTSKRDELLVTVVLDLSTRRFVLYRKEKSDPKFQRIEDVDWPWTDSDRYRCLWLNGTLVEFEDDASLMYAYCSYAELFGQARPTFRLAALDKIDETKNWVVARQPHASYLNKETPFLRRVMSSSLVNMMSRLNRTSGLREMLAKMRKQHNNVYIGGNAALYILGLIPECPKLIEIFIPITNFTLMENANKPGDAEYEVMETRYGFDPSLFGKTRQDENGTLLFHVFTSLQKRQMRYFLESNDDDDEYENYDTDSESEAGGYDAMMFESESNLRFVVQYFTPPSAGLLPKLETNRNTTFISSDMRDVYSIECICKRPPQLKDVQSTMKLKMICDCTSVAWKTYNHWRKRTYRFGSKLFVNLEKKYEKFICEWERSNTMI